MSGTLWWRRWLICWVVLSDASSIAVAQVLQDTQQCTLLIMLPLTDTRTTAPFPHNVTAFGYGSWPSPERLQRASFGWMASAELAVSHFNARHPVLVEELSTLGACQISLSSLYRDAGYSRSLTVRQALQDGLLENRICGVIGPVEARAHEGLSVLTEAAQIPQIGFKTIGRNLERVPQDSPTLCRIIPSLHDYASAIAKYIQRGDVFQRQYVSVLYDMEWGDDFENTLEDTRSTLDYFIMTEHFEEGDEESIRDALGKVAEKGYRTIVLILNRPSMIPFIARVAQDLGLLGREYFWIISGDALPPAILETVKYPGDSPEDRLLRGAALFTNYDQFVYDDTDPFLDTWRSLNETFVEQLNSIRPVKQKYKASSDYFQTVSPTEYSSFLYDSVIAVGISACQTQESHFKSLVNIRFTGASGRVRFQGNSRDPIDMKYGVYNLSPGFLQYGMRGYKPVLTSVYSNDYTFTDHDGNTFSGAWRNIPDTDFIFYDGTPNEPKPLVTDKNPHYLSKGTKIAGIFFSSFAVVLILASALFVYFQRNTRLVRPAQPDFLYILCFGAGLVACSPFFISFDEEKGYNEDQLSMLCSALPWCFVVGYLIMYSSLFSKLWRLSRILQMRRRKVSVKQALFPFAIVIVFCILVLAVWQLLDPLVWERRVISKDPYETYGHCQSVNIGVAPFLTPLACMIFLAVSGTAIFSWRLRDVQSELSSSKLIFAGTLCHIQIWIVGAAVASDTGTMPRDAAFLMFVAVTWFFSVSQVAIVIWPRAYVWASLKLCGGATRRAPVRFSIGGGSTTRVSGLQIIDSSRSNAHFHATDQCVASAEQGLQSTEQSREQDRPKEESTASCDGSKEVITIENLRG